MQPYRSLLFVPGSDADSTEAAETAGADAVVIDLEEGSRPTTRTLHGNGLSKCSPAGSGTYPSASA